VLGEQDKNVNDIEKKHRVKVYSFEDSRTNQYVIEITGKQQKVNEAFQELVALKDNNIPIKISSHIPSAEKKDVSGYVYTAFNGKTIVPISANQKKYIEAIKKYDLVFGIGPAGTGKTYLAVASALLMLESGRVQKIVLTRPVVESGEKLGFLPGDLYEKINPYLRPLYDAFHTMLGPEKFKRYREDETIEIVPLAYMRGRTLENAFIILDEAQNTVAEQMKMFLTRMGFNSQAVVTGDVTQIDLDNKKQSGLVQCQKILKNIAGIDFVHFNESDVIRHKLVREIVKAYDLWEKRADA